MTDKVYKLLEMVGTSTKSSDDAIQNAIARAAQTVRNLDWFEVMENRGSIRNGKIASYQVTLKIGFKLE
jgi:flavin-binding protein dodecin